MQFFDKLKKKKESLNKLIRIHRTCDRLEKKLDLQMFHHYAALALNRSESGLNKNPRTEKIIVSLTTFGNRLLDAFMVVESLMQQSLKADKIILWLSREEYEGKNLPIILEKQKEFGLDVCFCNENKSYNKIIPTLQRYPNDLIITVDDDFIYPFNLIETLYESYINEPQYIHCHRAHLIRFDSKNKLMPYLSWEWETNETAPSHKIFPTGVGGVLYFPGCLDNDVTKTELFKQLCPRADDVWLKIMALKKGTKAKKVPYNVHWDESVSIPESQGESSLWMYNNAQKHQETGNDKQIRAVLEHYPELYALLHSDS